MRDDSPAPRAGPRAGLARLPERSELAPLTAVAVVAGFVCADWIASASILLLFFIWRWLRSEATPPILSLALTFQWLQVVAGLFYFGLTGRELRAISGSDYRTMVLLGLGCILSLLLGLVLGLRLGVRPPPGDRPSSIPFRPLVVGYLASVALSGVIQQVAWLFPGLTQGILALSYFRYAIVFLLLRRLTSPPARWNWVGALLATEVVLGATGFFASFREPLMIAVLALLERFDRRQSRHWARLAALGLLIVGFGLLWTGIKGEYRRAINDELGSSRRARVERLGSLSSEHLRATWEDLALDMDALVDRTWAVYYPALAVSRVPSVLPHTGGTILTAAVRHVLAPRLFFPEKSDLPSDSEMVRQYSGVWVAGPEQGTTIAFGYVAESYLDFGVPLMFAPVLALGLAMGLSYRFWLRVIPNSNLAAALVAVIFWLSLHQFERSWARILGLWVTLMVYLGGGTYLLDRFVRRRSRPALLRGRSTRPPLRRPAPLAAMATSPSPTKATRPGERRPE